MCAELGARRRSTTRPTTTARFVRNRIRHELLPLLADVAGRDPVPVLARQAELLADEADLLDDLAAAIDPTDARRWPAAHPVLARRARAPLAAGRAGRPRAASALVGRGRPGAGRGPAARSSACELARRPQRAAARPAGCTLSGPGRRRDGPR